MVAKKSKVVKRKQVRKAKIIRDLIVCEEIREEVRGKMTLIGVYNDDIVLQGWPKEGVLAMNLAFLVRFQSDKSTTFVVKLFGPNKKVELLDLNGKFNPGKLAIGQTVALAIKGAGPLQLPEPGCYTFQFEYEGKRDSREFWVKVNPNVNEK